MKIILSLFVIIFLNACASTNKYSQSEFLTSNYQNNIDKLITDSDSLNGFSNNDNETDKIELSDVAKLMQADVYFNHGDYNNALIIYQFLAIKYQIPRIIYKSILCYQLVGVDKINADAYNQLIILFINASPNSNLANILSIKLQLTNNNYDKAIYILNQLMQSNNINPRDSLLLLSTNLRNNISEINPISLNNFAKYVLEKYANYPEAYLLASVCYANANNVYVLQQVLLNIENKFPSWQVPLFWSVGILSNNQNYATILYLTKTFIDKSQIQDPNIQNIYIGALINNKQSNIAKAYLVNQLKNEHSSNTLLNLGMLFAYQKKYDEALTYLVQVDVENIAINNMVKLLTGLIYDYKKQPSQAIKFYLQIKGSAYLESISAILLANDYSLTNNEIELNNILNKMVDNANLSGTDAIIFKAKYLIASSKYINSYKLLKLKLVQNLKNKDFIYYYATSCAFSGHIEDAIKYYKLYIKLEPKQANGYNDLAYLYITKKNNIKLATLYAHKALMISPVDPNILDTVGVIYLKKREYNTAYAYINSSYQMTHDFESAKHLKEVLLKLKQNSVANLLEITDKNDYNKQLQLLLLDKMLNLLMLLQYGVKIDY